VSDALLVGWYRDLPQMRPGDEPDVWAARMHQALKRFRRKLRVRYTEGTLQRALAHPDVEVRRAAVLALGLVGTIDSNAPLARLLYDEDDLVARTAADSLWEVWFRGGPDDAVLDLQRVLRLDDAEKALAGLDAITREHPEFAEPYNQRAIVFFQRGDFARSVADCERTLELNPYHFGAQAGMGQCYMKLRKYAAALRSFKLALSINPTLDDLCETIRALEEVAGEN
jgi:tetratricopeptide (TPR) repeat protein